MNYFLNNLIKGAASINLTGREIKLSDIENQLSQLELRALVEKKSVKTIIEQELFELKTGQILVFFSVVFFLSLSLIMVHLKYSWILSSLSIIIAQIILFTPKVLIHYINQKETI